MRTGRDDPGGAPATVHRRGVADRSRGGTHSPWISRLFRELGHGVIVANPRKLRLNYEKDRKLNRTDAEYLDRDQFVRIRPRLNSHVRGAVKSWGEL